MYCVVDERHASELWSLEYLNDRLEAVGIHVPRVRCLQAVVESSGYGLGSDGSVVNDLIPVPLNPSVSDAAAQVATASSVFRDTMNASATLLVADSKDMTANEWLRLLALLTMKCSSSDIISNVAAEMETAAAEKCPAPQHPYQRSRQSLTVFFPTKSRLNLRLKRRWR